MKPSEIWKEVKPRIGEMLVAVNDIETRAEKAQEEAYQRGLNDAREGKASCQFCRFTDVRQDMEPCASCSNNYDNKFEPEEQEEMDGLRQNIQTIVDQCGYTLDEIAEVLQKMKEAE